MAKSVKKETKEDAAYRILEEQQEAMKGKEKK